MTVAECLEEGARLLETAGWCQGSAYGANGEVCAVEANHRSLPGIMDAPVRYEAYRNLRRALGELGWVYGLIGWNDTPGRTKEEVIALFRRAAELARLQDSRAGQVP